MTHTINWFEIPVNDITRAAKFYGTILAGDMAVHEFMGRKRALLPGKDGVGGSIVQGAGYVPNMNGVVIYLNGGEDLETVLRRVEPAGGKIMLRKTSIGAYGFIALFMDPEGNRLGLHSKG